MKKLIIFLMSCLLACLPAMPAAAQELVVSAAASLTNAFNDVKAEFERINPGVRVTPNYASSGALFRQIEQGAPVDVFASANPKWMNDAVSAGFALESDVVVFAQNTLVLAVPAANQAAVSGADDLKQDRVQRIGVGTPETVPAGAYAKSSLQGLGMWDELQPKMIFAEHVRQVLDYVQRGEVDAGLMYATDAAQGGERVKAVATLPLPKSVTYPIAPINKSEQPELAKKFIQFILSDHGQEILARHGFSRPE
jgi:molybdate transport system substrate-binding protein